VCGLAGHAEEFGFYSESHENIFRGFKQEKDVTQFSFVKIPGSYWGEAALQTVGVCVGTLNQSRANGPFDQGGP
jgi:hypothetical protein